MEPIVTLPYSEWLVAEQLMKQLPARQGYSVYAPLSRQEKGVDLLVTRRATGKTYVAAPATASPTTTRPRVAASTRERSENLMRPAEVAARSRPLGQCG